MKSDNRFARARFALNRIQQTAPRTPEANLVFAKFTQAVSDLTMAREGRSCHGLISALVYLSAPTIHDLSLLGIETEWAIQQLFKAGVFA